MGVISSCASISTNRNRVGDPRVLGDIYRGTADIETFEALIYHCFASYSRPFFKSMILPGDIPQPGDKREVIPLRGLMPSSMLQFSGIRYSPSVSPNDPIPDLPKGATLKGTISASYPVSDPPQPDGRSEMAHR
jgi:hypothetical protein